jgi:excisionase family DNA binding protein
MARMDTAEVVAATIRLPEAAERARVPARTLRDWIADGKLAAWKIGGRLRVRPEDVDRLAQPVSPAPRPAPAPRQPFGQAVTTAEAGRRLGVSAKTVREWVAASRLRGAKVGDRLLVEEASVAAMERQRLNCRPGHVKDWR